MTESVVWALAHSPNDRNSQGWASAKARNTMQALWVGGRSPGTMAISMTSQAGGHSPGTVPVASQAGLHLQEAGP